ncbi:hypothetical protein ACNKU7_09615 [Microbulbifer sp. SA54]|uniref:hypothetical protein n=1 Tax=Microbulbifer sp. SA54 TaxID=3401577 RepID=UPI003AAA3F70
MEQQRIDEEEELALERSRIEQLQSQLRKLGLQQSCQQVIHAPIAGTVQGLAIHTRGAVLNRPRP